MQVSFCFSSNHTQAYATKTHYFDSKIQKADIKETTEPLMKCAQAFNVNGDLYITPAQTINAHDGGTKNTRTDTLS